MPVCLGDFVESAKPISASMPLSAVVDRFLNDPQAQYFILVRDKRPAGLISRTLTFEFAASSGENKHAQLAIGDLITARALILKSDTTVEAFIEKAGKHIDAVIRRGCIIVEDRRFKGVLSPAKFRNALMSAFATEPDHGPTPSKPAQSAKDRTQSSSTNRISQPK